MQNRTAADVTEKKKKGKPSMGRLRLLRFVAFFLLFACVVITVLAILGPMAGQIRQTSLPDSHLQHAITLLNTPATIDISSEDIALEFWEYGQNLYGKSYVVCVSLSLNSEDPSETIEQYYSSRLIANNSWVIGAKETLIGGASPPHNFWCGQGKLETGIHLVEFELRDSMFGEPIYTHQWAIEIEAD